MSGEHTAGTFTNRLCSQEFRNYLKALRLRNTVTHSGTLIRVMYIVVNGVNQRIELR